MKSIQEKYFQMLSKEYPSIQSICREIIHLNALLNLPKGTEHYISDLHGEYSAFQHLMNTCSGVIEEKVIFVFKDELTYQEIQELCSLIYDPQKILCQDHSQKWYQQNILKLIRLCRYVTSKYSRSEVRKYIDNEYADIIDELIHAQLDELDQQYIYHLQIIDIVINLDEQNTFINILIHMIKHFAIAKLHILGDIFDRGAHPDFIMNDLIDFKRVDIQWGNHDILWMGAYLGQEACIITVIKNCLHYNNIGLVEKRYGIPLRKFMIAACQKYPDIDEKKAMEKYCFDLLIQLESALIAKYPAWQMDYRVENKNFTPLSSEEISLLEDLKKSFRQSIQLKKHMDFLFSKGSLYLRTNHNLLLHGCIPLDNDGHLYQYHHFNKVLEGKEYFDYVNDLIKRAYFYKNKEDVDYFWYLWCGQYSPLCGRQIILDKAGDEEKNAYYSYIEDAHVCIKLLHEFHLYEKECMIINGHTPVKVKEGESPLKGDNKLVVIDGGFCVQNQVKTGVAGYTLISNSHGMRLKTHRIASNLKSDEDRYISEIVYTREKQEMIKDTKEGYYIEEKIDDLKQLLQYEKTNMKNTL